MFILYDKYIVIDLQKQGVNGLDELRMGLEPSLSGFWPMVLESPKLFFFNHVPYRFPVAAAYT
jgi:hypothetical protein